MQRKKVVVRKQLMKCVGTWFFSNTLSRINSVSHRTDILMSSKFSIHSVIIYCSCSLTSGSRNAKGNCKEGGAIHWNRVQHIADLQQAHNTELGGEGMHCLQSQISAIWGYGLDTDNWISAGRKAAPWQARGQIMCGSNQMCWHPNPGTPLLSNSLSLLPSLSFFSPIYSHQHLFTHHGPFCYRKLKHSIIAPVYYLEENVQL